MNPHHLEDVEDNPIPIKSIMYPEISIIWYHILIDFIFNFNLIVKEFGFVEGILRILIFKCYS